MSVAQKGNSTVYVLFGAKPLHHLSQEYFLLIRIL